MKQKAGELHIFPNFLSVTEVTQPGTQGTRPMRVYRKSRLHFKFWSPSLKKLVNPAARLMLVLAVLMCSGCAVIAVADAAVSVTATVVKTGVKAAGAAINAVLPD